MIAWGTCRNSSTIPRTASSSSGTTPDTQIQRFRRPTRTIGRPASCVRLIQTISRPSSATTQTTGLSGGRRPRPASRKSGTTTIRSPAAKTPMSFPRGDLLNHRITAGMILGPVSDQASALESWIYESAHHRVAKYKDPLANTTAFQYFAAGNLKRIDYPLVTPRRARWRDAVGVGSLRVRRVWRHDGPSLGLEPPRRVRVLRLGRFRPGRIPQGAYRRRAGRRAADRLHVHEPRRRRVRDGSGRPRHDVRAQCPAPAYPDPLAAGPIRVYRQRKSAATTISTTTSSRSTRGTSGVDGTVQANEWVDDDARLRCPESAHGGHRRG